MVFVAAESAWEGFGRPDQRRTSWSRQTRESPSGQLMASNVLGRRKLYNVSRSSGLSAATGKSTVSATQTAQSCKSTSDQSRTTGKLTRADDAARRWAELEQTTILSLV